MSEILAPLAQGRAWVPYICHWLSGQLGPAPYLSLGCPRGFMTFVTVGLGLSVEKAQNLTL